LYVILLGDAVNKYIAGETKNRTRWLLYILMRDCELDQNW